MLNNRKVLICLVIIYCFSILPTSLVWGFGPIDDLLYPPYPLTERERATLGVVGITRGFYAPEAVLNTFAKGKDVGAAKGAAGGFLNAMGEMGPCSGSFCGLAVLLWMATAGVVGAIYGGATGYTDALPAEEAKRIEDSMEAFYADLDLQNRIADKLFQMACEKTSKPLVSINRIGPTAAGDNVDYSPLRNIPIDSVLEISVVDFGFRTWPRELKPPKNMAVNDTDPPLSLFFNIRPRLLRLTDSGVLYQPRLEIWSKFLKRSEWMANQNQFFFDEMESLLNAVVDKVSDDIFITYYLPGEEPEFIK